MKRMFVMLGWINSGGTRQPKWNGCQTLLAAALLLGAAAGAQAQFAAGDGSAGGPWQIETPAQLSAVSNYWWGPLGRFISARRRCRWMTGPAG